MTPSKHAGLDCLECGQAIPDERRWLCSARCAAVMAIVRYGRKRAAGEDPDEEGLDDARLRRYAGGATIEGEAPVIGQFPTQSVLEKVRVRDHHTCQYEGCQARGAHEVDYWARDPDLQRRPQARDLRTLCSVHHRSESLDRFVGALGRVAHTAPATWARIEAAEPLVLRDNHKLWTDRNVRLLSAWPLASEETRADLERWIKVLGELPSKVRGASDGVPPDPVAQLNTAVDQLGLRGRREKRLVRAIHALLLPPLVDEASNESLTAIS